DIAEALKPGVRENEIVALASKRLYEMGSDCVEAINAISGERCSPHPHNFTDRMIRPGDQAFFDIIQSFVGYRTCYYRTFNVGRATRAQVDAYRKAREWMDKAIAMLKPGVATDRIARCFPRAQEIGCSSEMEAFGLNFCHGLGLGLHERPIISRLNSLDDPMELEAGMVFAVETYCPAGDGISAGREGLPFVARGAGTGLSGGCLPAEGGLVISMMRMNRVLEVDYENQLAVVEPGLVNLHLSWAVGPKGYYYAPDPSSQQACTLGGNIANNSGGPHTLKYGVTTNHVLGLEVVMPDGEIVWLGGRTRATPGYD